MSADDRRSEDAQPIIYPEDILPPGRTVIVGVQHVIAMFGATALAPILMGFDPNVAILFSGIGTLLFFIIVGGNVPSYLGSSFSFISVVIAVTGYSGTPPNMNIPLALGGIVTAGAVYAFVGAIVIVVGYRWVESLMPPVVTGTIVAIIGLNLAPVAVRSITTTNIDVYFGVLTIFLVCISAAYAPGFFGRLPIIIGGGLAYFLYFIASNFVSLGVTPIDFTKVDSSDWFGLPHFTTATFEPNAMLAIMPVALILVAENLGHVKAVAAGINRSLDPYLGRAFLADGLATMLSGYCGGTGVTTYAENIGVMGVTKIYSSFTFIVAALFAILIGLSPKCGALIQTIPAPVLGGLSFVLFGLITATGGRIWVDNKVDFTDPKNLLSAGVALVVGSGDLSIKIGDFSLGGIGTATVVAILLYHALRFRT